jgi:arginyl-tRNA synthetase
MSLAPPCLSHNAIIALCLQISKFYENCSVNNAETPELKASRLSLCTVSAATIRLLLNLLGIPVVEKL